jgi:hypothetical protein
MVQLDAAIKLFAPSVTLAKREATKFARSMHLVVGELSRRCNWAMREADGQPITADMLAVTAMRRRAWTLATGICARTSADASPGCLPGCCRARRW